MTSVIIGCIIGAIGLLFFIMAVVALATKKEILFYRFLVAKSRLLWKDKVHYFYLVSGILMIIVAVLVATIPLWQ